MSAALAPAVLLGLTVWGAFAHGGLFATISLCCMLLACLPGVVSRRWVMPPSFVSGWQGLLVAHVALGMGLNLYECSASYDKVVHFFAFFWTAQVVFEGIERWEHHNRVLVPWRSVVVMLLGLGVGACWELFEFTIDQLGLFVAQKGLQDTMLDFVCDGMGLLALIGYRATVPRAVHPIRSLGW